MPWVHGFNCNHSLASFQWSGFFDWQTLHLTPDSDPEMVPLQGEGSGFWAHLYKQGEKWARANQGFSIASQGSCQVHGTTC